MQATNLPTNGHARIQDADFQELLRTKDLPETLPVNNPLDDGAREKKAMSRKERRSFQALVDEIMRGGEKKKSERTLPEFPLQALPPILKAWVEGIARQTQTGADAAAMLALAVSSAAVARNVSIQARPDLAAPLNLYVGVLAGDRSEQVMKLAAAPLRELEVQELARHREAAAKDRVRLRRDMRNLRQIERISERTQEPEDLANIALIDESLVEAELGRTPPAPRRILEEVNARAIDFQLSELGRIASFSPRGGLFRQLAGRSSASRDRLIELLEGCHSADDRLISLPRGKSQYVGRATITCAAILDRPLVSEIAAQRNKAARSLLSRFLFAVPEDQTGSRLVAPPVVSVDVASAYREGIRRLAARPMTTLTLSPEAESLHREFEANIETQLGDFGPLSPIGSWAEGLRHQALRIAGVLHAWISDGKVVSRETIGAAIEIARYLIPHAAAALERLGVADDNCDECEHALLRFARIAKQFSAREAYQHLRRTLLKPSLLRAALAALVARGYLRDIDGRGRRFAVVSRVISLTDLKTAAPQTGDATPLPSSSPPRADESAKGTQPFVGVPPLGGLKAG